MSKSQGIQKIRVIDSHTGGEPTRLVIEGGPDLGSGNLADRLSVFREQHDAFRSAVVNEPRGSDVLVGGLLCEPTDANCVAGVIFFNNVGYLGMCGHGTMGLVRTLEHLGRIGPGVHRIETPVGVVEATLADSGEVSIQNVASYRTQKSVCLDVPGFGTVTGDVAWGGNWFFLCQDHGQRIEPDNVNKLTECSWAIRHQLTQEAIVGDDGGEIDHIELFGDPSGPHADSQSFVLCPGGAFDRSPCGTGTSAKAACLFADGKLQPGQTWRQASVVGSVFEVSVKDVGDGRVLPTVRGSAYITADATLMIDPNDPFAMGIGP